MGLNKFLVGICAVFVVVSCAGLPFGYKYYGMNLAHYDGTLLGPKPENDLPFGSCEPTAADKNPCVVLFSTEFFALKKDYLGIKQKLMECQGRQ